MSFCSMVADLSPQLSLTRGEKVARSNPLTLHPFHPNLSFQFLINLNPPN